MKSCFLIIIASAVFLTACGKRPPADSSSTTNPTNDTVEHGYVMTDLGICSAEDTALPLNARNPWDLTIVDGNVYVATGDFGDNSGPASIWAYDSQLQRWASSATVEQEAIARFVSIHNQTIALGVDPVGQPQYASSYVLNDGGWKTFSQIENTLHVFDAEVYADDIYYGLGSNGDYPAVVKFDAATGKYIGIPLYKNKIEVIPVISKAENLQNRRVYDLFAVNNSLFCSFSCTYTTGKITLEFYELKDGRFEFRQAFINSTLKMNNKTVRNQVIFNSDTTYNGSCYISLGNLYKTEDFVQFDKIDVPYNACVTDLYTEVLNGKEQLYVLATVSDGVGYKNTVYTVLDNHLTEVFTFHYATSALSLVKSGMDFYVGLGGQDSASTDNGRILKFAYH